MNFLSEIASVQNIDLIILSCVFISALFLFFSIGGRISRWKTSNINKKFAALIGVIFFLISIGLHIISDKTKSQLSEHNLTFTSVLFESAPPLALRDSTKVRLDNMIQEDLLRQAKVFIRSLVPNESNIDESLLVEALLDIIPTTINDTQLPSGALVIRAEGFAKLDIENTKQWIQKLKIEQSLFDEYQSLFDEYNTSRTEIAKISRQIRRIEEKYKDVTDNMNADTDKNLVTDLQTQLKDAYSSNSQLTSHQLYRRALVKEALGLSKDKWKNLLDQAIMLAPHNIDARLMRYTSDDQKYLLQYAPEADVKPHIDKAREALRQNEYLKAKEILGNVPLLFDEFSVIEIIFDFDDDEILFREILESLTLEADSWSRPSWMLKDYYLIGDGRLLLWNNLIESVRLLFNRYGFEDAMIHIPIDNSDRGIRKYKMLIKEKPALPSAPNVLNGKITLADSIRNSGDISVQLVATKGPNKGFHRATLTSHDGTFSLTGIPNGEFELEFKKENYVRYRLPIDINDGDLRCFIDMNRHYDRQGIVPCNLHEIGLKLYPVYRIKLTWVLQEDPMSYSFPDLYFLRETELSSELPYDWYRGGWYCCESSFKFGSATIDAKNPDLVIFTDTDGLLYFDQPHDKFIAADQENFEMLKKIPENLNFMTRALVKEGHVYILRTNLTGNDSTIQFFVKIKVLSIQKLTH